MNPIILIKNFRILGRLKYWREIKVEEGMFFTIEPGAYVKGEGGFRIENDVMIRNGKVPSLTKAKFEHIH